MELMRALMRAVVHTPAGPHTPADVMEGARRDIRAASPRQWRAAMDVLNENRMAAPVGGALESAGWLGDVRAPFDQKLYRAHRMAIHRNFLRMALYGRLVEAFRSRVNVEPILLKSGALVALLHPDLSSHGMGDVDFLVAQNEVDRVKSVVADMGYRQIPTDDDSLSFTHPSGALLVDFHCRFRLFERFGPLERLVRDLPAAHPALDTVRVLEPNAMVAHLAHHMNEHRRRMGYRLRWLLDVALAARHWGDQLDVNRIAALLPGAADVAVVLRSIAFFDRELALPAPASLRAALENVEPFTLDEVCRSQRVTSWPLDSARGWARLAQCAAGLAHRGRRFYPRVSDPICAIADARRERRALAATQATLSNHTPRTAVVEA
jgi:hypothetical protein